MAFIILTPNNLDDPTDLDLVSYKEFVKYVDSFQLH